MCYDERVQNDSAFPETSRPLDGMHVVTSVPAGSFALDNWAFVAGFALDVLLSIQCLSWI